jgi:hypothetical protein
MTSEIIFLVEDAPEGGLLARALSESIFTDGEDFEQLKSNIKEAVEAHFEPDKQPRIVRLHYVKEEIMAI